MLARELGAKLRLSRMVYSGDISKEKSSEPGRVCADSEPATSKKKARAVTLWTRRFLTSELVWSAMNRRQNKWALSAVLTLLLCLSQTSFARSTPKAKTLYANGQTAEAKDDPITAYEDYYQAWKLEPKNLRYKVAFERLRFVAASAHVTRGEKLLAQKDTTGALTEFFRAPEIAPTH